MPITLERPQTETRVSELPAPVVQLPKAATPPPVPPSKTPKQRSWSISPGALAAIWTAVIIAVVVIGPEPADPSVRPTLLLTVMAEVAAIAVYATVLMGMARARLTGAFGLFTGGVLLTGHLICGLEGHVPMTGAVWPTQLMLVAGVTILSGVALATRR